MINLIQQLKYESSLQRAVYIVIFLYLVLEMSHVFFFLCVYMCVVSIEKGEKIIKTYSTVKILLCFLKTVYISIFCLKCFVFFLCVHVFVYAVKVQRSLAPLSWLPGSRKPTAHCTNVVDFRVMRRAEDCIHCQ